LVRLLLGAGELDGKQIVSSSAMERIAKPHAPTGEDILVWGASPGAEDSRYGLGVNVERINGHECLTHGGGMVGYASFVLADRTSGIGVAVLTNINGDIPAAQLIARIAHDLFLAVVEERALPDLPDPAGGLRSAEMPDAMFGSFEALVTYGTPVHLEIEAGPDGLLCVIADGEHGRVYRTWSKRFVTDHPGLRTHHLQFDGLHWIHGPFMFSPKGAQETQPKLDDRLLAYVGHYRGYSPWYTNFRIVARNGRLYLLAPGGVEAPSEDVELVELTEGTFRLGADPWLPERLLAGPLVNGRAISMARDGAIYSRAFTK
jgi:D-alanyl-D-alanine carboxypeptidase